MAFLIDTGIGVNFPLSRLDKTKKRGCFILNDIRDTTENITKTYTNAAVITITAISSTSNLPTATSATFTTTTIVPTITIPPIPTLLLFPLLLRPLL